MLIAAVIGLTLLSGLLTGALLWAVRRGDSRIDQLMVANERNVKATLAAERAEFEREKIAIALTAENARAEALTEFVSNYAGETDENADLDPDDVDGRVLRIARKWGNANRSAVPSSKERNLHNTAEPRATDADVRATPRRNDTDLMQPSD